MEKLGMPDVPTAIAADTRLTLETMRVLIALYPLQDKEFPGRERLSESCGMHPSNISESTTKLIRLGWITKNGSEYSLTIPKEIPEIIQANREKIQSWKDNKRPDIPANIRRLVFERDAYRCVKCSSYKKLCVDHIFPYSLGGASTPDNLQTLCWECNSKKSNKVEVAA